MSIQTHHNATSAAAQPYRGLWEQIEGRVRGTNAGIGRLDILETVFAGRTVDVDRFVELTNGPFATNAEHPTLAGFQLIAGSARIQDRLTGVSFVSASYLGSNRFPDLPDGYCIGTENGEMVFQGHIAPPGVRAINTTSGIPDAKLVFPIYYVEHVHFSDIMPMTSANVGKVFLLTEKFIQGGSAALVLQSSEVIDTQGSWHRIRDQYVPIVAALNQNVFSAVDDRIINSGKLRGLDWGAMELEFSAVDVDITPVEMAMYAVVFGGDNKRIKYIGATTPLSLARCTRYDSVYMRQGGDA